MGKPVVLITAALYGIGRATANAFARDGYCVVVSGRRDDLGEAFAQELRDSGAEAEYVHADVRNETEISDLVDFAIHRFGRLDVAVNNAATEGFIGPVTDITPQRYAEAFDTNVRGVLIGMKHQLRAMVPQGSGSIVNISSTLGKQGAAHATLYIASKHALEGLTKSAALEVATSGVRINAVSPGPIDTEMLARFTGTAEVKAQLIEGVPAKRLGTPDEIAEAILFVGSSKAAFMTGAFLAVDGGKLASGLEG